jgi:putative DNA primase/helicase
MKVAHGVLKDPGGWQARVLNGIAEIPILRPDGSICTEPGYDWATGIFFAANGTVFPPIPDHPTRADALEALAKLEEPLKDFPFIEPHHKSAAIAMILTAIIRRQLTHAPAFGVSAREAGTGKGLIIEIMAAIATGRAAPVTPFTVDEDEQRKRITSSLLSGHAMINIDNVDAPINSAALAALLTSEIWSERILGVSKKADVPSNALVVMMGNNLIIEGDMTRRVIPIELDAGCERPELRIFDRDPATWALENRGVLVAAALTVLSA